MECPFGIGKRRRKLRSSKQIGVDFSNMVARCLYQTATNSVGLMRVDYTNRLVKLIPHHLYGSCKVTIIGDNNGLIESAIEAV